jgi:hypothetical protein
MASQEASSLTPSASIRRHPSSEGVGTLAIRMGDDFDEGRAPAPTSAKRERIEEGALRG